MCVSYAASAKKSSGIDMAAAAFEKMPPRPAASAKDYMRESHEAVAQKLLLQ